MGSLFVYLTLFSAGLIILGALKIVLAVLPYERISRVYFKLKNKIMWGSYLLLLTEGYLEILISAYLNV